MTCTPHRTNEELLHEYLSGDGDQTDLTEQLYYNNIGLINSVAKESAAAFHCIRYEEKEPDKLTRYTHEILSDLRNEGAMAMFLKLRKKDYDGTKGEFSTYIYPYLKSAMYRYLEQSIGNVALSKSNAETIRRAQQMYDSGWNTTAIAATLQISATEVIKAIRYNTHAMSFYDLIPEDREEDEGYLPYERFSDYFESEQPPNREVYHRRCLELLYPLFQKLTERDRSLLGHYYGLYGYKKLPLDTIALEEMLTVDGVGKAVKTAIRHLQEKYPNSALKAWRDAHSAVRHAQNAWSS